MAPDPGLGATSGRQVESLVPEADFAFVVSQSPMVIGRNDLAPPYATTFVTPNIERLFGHRLEDVLGVPGWLVDHVHPDDLDQALAMVSEAIESDEQAASAEFRFLHGDGDFRSVIVRVHIAPDHDGEAATLLWYALDVTERVRAEEQRALSVEQLTQGERLASLGQLAGGVAHNINNLLTVIFANIDFIRSELQGPVETVTPSTSTAVRSHLAAIELSAARAANLARRLLAFGGSDPAQPEVVHLDALVAGLAGLLHRTLGDQIEYSWDAPADLWPVLADPDDIEQAVLNLAANARDAMPDGGTLAIHLANIERGSGATSGDLPAGRSASLTVVDTGIGMSPDILRRVFEPFFTTKAPGSGTGLGLASVYDSVAAHRGRVDIQSAPGHGSSVQVVLPALALDPGEAVEVQARHEVPRLGQGEVVLVVDDEEPVRDAAAGILTRHGYEVLAAHGGAAALRLCAVESRRIDLLLTDIVMPRIDGVELANAAQALRPSLAVVLMSGRTASLDDTIPARRFLSKPFSSEQLLRAVGEALDAVER